MCLPQNVKVQYEQKNTNKNANEKNMPNISSVFLKRESEESFS